MIRSAQPDALRRRPGFTLVELLVAAAICVIIMTVLATAFQLGIETMRQMRSAGELAAQLRAANEVIRRDLQAPMFLPEEGKLNQGTTLSTQRFDLGDAPPIGGFFAVNSPASTAEGTDADGLASTTTTNHTLQFTSVLPKLNGEQGLFTATSPAVPQTINGLTFSPQTFTSPAAELAYFLSPIPLIPGGTAQLMTTGPSPQPLFNLVRRQRLVAMSDDDALALVTFPNPASTTTPLLTDPDVISVGAAIAGAPPSGNTTPVNTLRALTSSGNRLALAQIATTSRLGEDILLSNVLSFEVKLNWTTLTPGVPTPRQFGLSALTSGTSDNPLTNPLLATVNSDFPFDTLAVFGPPNFPLATFDTANASAMPLRVRAIQIRVRIYDPKIQLSRQISVVQNF